MRSPCAWLLDVLLGVRCRVTPDCRYRVRGRDAGAYIFHLWDHAGELS